MNSLSNGQKFQINVKSLGKSIKAGTSKSASFLKALFTGKFTKLKQIKKMPKMSDVFRGAQTVYSLKVGAQKLQSTVSDTSFSAIQRKLGKFNEISQKFKENGSISQEDYKYLLGVEKATTGSVNEEVRSLLIKVNDQTKKANESLNEIDKSYENKKTLTNKQKQSLDQFSQSKNSEISKKAKALIQKDLDADNKTIRQITSKYEDKVTSEEFDRLFEIASKDDGLFPQSKTAQEGLEALFKYYIKLNNVQQYAKKVLNGTEPGKKSLVISALLQKEDGKGFLAGYIKESSVQNKSSVVLILLQSKSGIDFLTNTFSKLEESDQSVVREAINSKIKAQVETLVQATGKKVLEKNDAEQIESVVRELETLLDVQRDLGGQSTLELSEKVHQAAESLKKHQSSKREEVKTYNPDDFSRDFSAKYLDTGLGLEVLTTSLQQNIVHGYVENSEKNKAGLPKIVDDLVDILKKDITETKEKAKFAIRRNALPKGVTKSDIIQKLIGGNTSEMTPVEAIQALGMVFQNLIGPMVSLESIQDMASDLQVVADKYSKNKTQYEAQNTQENALNSIKEKVDLLPEENKKFLKGMVAVFRDLAEVAANKEKEELDVWKAGFAISGVKYLGYEAGEVSRDLQGPLKDFLTAILLNETEVFGQK